MSQEDQILTKNIIIRTVSLADGIVVTRSQAKDLLKCVCSIKIRATDENLLNGVLQEQRYSRADQREEYPTD